jgi:hypothetical protein
VDPMEPSGLLQSRAVVMRVGSSINGPHHLQFFAQVSKVMRGLAHLSHFVEKAVVDALMSMQPNLNVSE